MTSERIRSSIEAAMKYLIEHPEQARYSDSPATATLVEGLLVRVDGPSGETLDTDMPQSVGGGGTGPSPGWIFRAALASCEATLIAMRAAVQGVELKLLEVIVDSKWTTAASWASTGRGPPDRLPSTFAFGSRPRTRRPIGSAT